MKIDNAKIMFNITCFQSDKPTGIERFGLQIAREVCKIDPSTMVVLSGQIEGISNKIISRILGISRSVFNKYEYLIRVIWDQTWLRYVVAKYKPNILFFPIQDGMFFPSVKQIITVHDLHYLHFDKSLPECREEINPLRKIFYHHKMPHVLARSAAVVAVSESTKHDIVASFGINPDKIHVVHNGYDEDRFYVIENIQEVLSRYGLQQRGYFLFVGSILRHKNIVRLVQAFAALDSSHSLIVAGAQKDNAYLNEILLCASELGLSNRRFNYLEFIPDDDLPYLYNGALAFVLPSLHEGFGVPIIEAMACGTPVITSNCSAMPEVAGSAALLIDPYSVESIATALCEILENPKNAEKLRAAGLERAKVFRWSFSAQKLYDICKMVSET